MWSEYSAKLKPSVTHTETAEKEWPRKPRKVTKSVSIVICTFSLFVSFRVLCGYFETYREFDAWMREQREQAQQWLIKRKVQEAESK